MIVWLDKLGSAKLQGLSKWHICGGSPCYGGGLKNSMAMSRDGKGEVYDRDSYRC